MHKIKVQFISTTQPESNSIIKRFNSTLIKHIRLSNNQEIFKNELIEIKTIYALLGITKVYIQQQK